MSLDPSFGICALVNQKVVIVSGTDYMFL